LGATKTRDPGHGTYSIFRTPVFSIIGKNKNRQFGFIYFYTFRKNTVAGLVNQKIKNKWPYTEFPISLISRRENSQFSAFSRVKNSQYEGYRTHSQWGKKIAGITSQWNYVLFLRFGLPFKMATSVSDFAKASDLFGINKFEKFQVNVLNKL